MFKQRLRIVGKHILEIIACLIIFVLFIGAIILILYLLEFIASVINITIDQFAIGLVWVLYGLVLILTLFILWKIYKFIHWLFIEPFQIARRRKKWAKQQKQS